MRKKIFLLLVCGVILIVGGFAACRCLASESEPPFLHDPFDRENPLVKLPGITLNYLSGKDGGTAIYFNGQNYLKEPALTFVPPGKNWIEGTVAFWIKPTVYPSAPNNVPLILFNWNHYPKPQAGYVGTISLSPEGKITDNCGWEWGGGNPPSITSKSSVPSESWSHVAVVWSKAEGYTRIYINDRLDAEAEMYCARGSNGVIYPWLAGYGGYEGAMGDLKIYSRAVHPPFTLKAPAHATKAYIPKPSVDTPASDVNIRRIPDFATPQRNNAFAVIIGIEKYQSLPSSDYSQSDAGLVKDYLKAMGFPERNIVLMINEKATKSGIEKSLEAWLPNRVKQDSIVFVYFSGHGAPEPASGDAYIVPYDGDPNYLPFTGYPLKRLYEKLGKLPAGEVMVVLDSCFSGAGGRSVLAQGARPLVMTPTTSSLATNMVVLSATQGSQISTSSPGKGHGIFTYYFLKAIKEGKKSMTDIYEYLSPQVEDEAKILNVEQHPSITPDVEKLKGKFNLVK